MNYCFNMLGYEVVQGGLSVNHCFLDQHLKLTWGQKHIHLFCRSTDMPSIRGNGAGWSFNQAYFNIVPGSDHKEFFNCRIMQTGFNL